MNQWLFLVLVSCGLWIAPVYGKGQTSELMNLLMVEGVLTSSSSSETVACKGQAVLDGRTLICETDQHTRLTVRLSQLDTPETQQPYGLQAKAYLSRMTQGQPLVVMVQGQDPTGRTMGRLFVMTLRGKCFENGLCVRGVKRSVELNHAMIADGYAWYVPAGQPEARYAQAEQEARQARRGVWAEDNLVPPRVLRKHHFP